MLDNQNTQNQAEEKGKIDKQYKEIMYKLIGIVEGEKNLFPLRRASKDVVKNVVEGLLKDKKETLEKEIKTEITNLLDLHVKTTADINKAEKEVEQLREKKKKEFVEAAKKVFNKIDGIDELAKGYYDALNLTKE